MFQVLIVLVGNRCLLLIPIRIGIKMMPTSKRILLQVSHMLENHNFFAFSHSLARSQCFIFLICVKDVIILSILHSILNLWIKVEFINFFICLALLPIPIRIGMPWKPMRIRIRQNDADPERCRYS